MEKFSLLFCDDEKLALQSLRLAIAEVSDFISFDPKKDWVATVMDALKLAKSPNFKYELVITDMIFEGEHEKLGGFKILEAVKASHPQTEVIVLTGYTEKISVADLFSVGDIYSLSSGTWVKKEGSPKDIAKRLALALRKLRPELDGRRERRWEEGCPYQVKLNDRSRVMTILVPKERLSFDVRGFQDRHWEILTVLAESKRPLGEQQLIDIVLARRMVPTESTKGLFPREIMIEIAHLIGGPYLKCQKHLSDEGKGCSHYEVCFPTLSKAAISKHPAPRGSTTETFRRPELHQCPLHLRISYSPPNLEKRPKRIAADINFIRKRIITTIGNRYLPLARSGEANDLLRRTETGYRLAASIID